MLKLTTDKHEASRFLSATAELLVVLRCRLLSVAIYNSFPACCVMQQKLATKFPFIFVVGFLRMGCEHGCEWITLYSLLLFTCWSRCIIITCHTSGWTPEVSTINLESAEHCMIFCDYFCILPSYQPSYFCVFCFLILVLW